MCYTRRKRLAYMFLITVTQSKRKTFQFTHRIGILLIIDEDEKSNFFLRWKFNLSFKKSGVNEYQENGSFIEIKIKYKEVWYFYILAMWRHTSCLLQCLTFIWYKFLYKKMGKCMQIILIQDRV